MRATEIVEDAKQYGVTKRTLEGAKAEAEIESVKRNNEWWWKLPKELVEALGIALVSASYQAQLEAHEHWVDAIARRDQGHEPRRVQVESYRRSVERGSRQLPLLPPRITTGGFNQKFDDAIRTG